MSSKQGHAISLSVNDSYVWYAQCLLSSLRRNWPNHPVVLVQYGGLTPTSIAALEAFPKVKLCAPEESIQGPPINLIPGADTRATYLRLNLWSDKFAEYENILYLDADTVVLRPLDDILARDEFVVFKDPITSTAGMFIDRADLTLHKLLTTDGFTLGGDMANGGVFVVPSRLRNQASLEEMLALLERYSPYIRFSDQTIINLWMLRHGLQPINDHRYNFLVKQPPEVLRSVGIDNIRVVHFAGFSEQSMRRKLLIQLAVTLCSSRLGRRAYACMQRLILELGPNYRFVKFG